MRRISLVSALSLALSLAVAAPASAATIIYQFTGTATLALAGTSFQSAPVSFTLTSDTTAITQVNASPLILVTPDTVLDFSVNGVAGTFNRAFHMFSTSFGPVTLVGLSPISGNDLLDVRGAPLSGYRLDTAIGPFTQAPPDFLNVGEEFGTSLGSLVFLDDRDASLTFQATILGNPIPEPSTWAMMLTGFAILGMVVRRRRAAGRKHQGYSAA